MNFQSGNQRVQEKILQDAMAKTLPHALLISGPKGMGKFAFVKELAKEVLQNSSPLPPELVTVDQLYLEGIHADLAELSHSSSFDQSHRKKTKKKSDTIGSDDIESCTKHLHETVMGEYKILCIRDIERMTIAASNKFLKILEEPPQKTLFLLTTSSPQNILSTISSRCRTEHFSLLSPSQIHAEITNDGRFFSDNEKKLLVLLSGGKGALLQSMMQDSEVFQEKKDAYTHLQSVITSSPLQKMEEAERVAKLPMAEIIAMLELYMVLYRDGMQEDFSRAEIVDGIDETLGLIKRNGNKRMLLEQLFWKLG